MVLKIMNEGNAWFQDLKSVTSPSIAFLYSLAAKPNLLSRQHFVKKIAKTSIFHMLPWQAM